MRRASQTDHPFKQEKSHIQLVQELQNWWFNPQQSQSTKVLSHPMNQKSTLSAIHFLINKLTKQKKTISITYIVDSKQRQTFIIKYTKCIMEKFFLQVPAARLPAITELHLSGLDVSQIVFCTFKDFVRNDLGSGYMYSGMIVETSHFVRSVRDSFTDYITDTYLRRAYIEALRLQEAYRDYDRPQNNKTYSQVVNKKKSSEVQLISLHSRQPSFQKKQTKVQPPAQQNSKKIRRTYEKKRQKMLEKNQKQQQIKFFQENQLILISGLIYIIGFFYNQLQIKKTRNFEQFIWDYQNKTSLNKQFLQNILRYFIQIYQNCPTQVYDKVQDMYLYSLCQFVNKIVSYCQIFSDDYQELFQITKPERYPVDRRESLIEESSSCLMITCKENNKICSKIIKQKAIKCIIIQNLACPEEYWHYIFRKNNILINPQTCSSFYSKLYGLHISKTPSNQDLNFAEKSRPDIQTIKIKACGVLLHDLSKFTPDGIAVYFYSLEGLENFIKQMDKDDQKILKRIDNNKKIFFESAFEEENHINFLKFKKCCQIGRGAIFFMAANGKAAQYLKFYKHLSRCIVFFGLPRKQLQTRKQIQPLQNEPPQQKVLLQLHHIIMDKIAIFNECINNCINNESDYKSVIFVGGQISSDLSTWYKSFIKSWDETTRESLMKLRNYFQKMDKFMRE